MGQLTTENIGLKFLQDINLPDGKYPGKIKGFVLTINKKQIEIEHNTAGLYMSCVCIIKNKKISIEPIILAKGE